MTSTHKNNFYDDNNVFAQILRKKIPAVSVYEDDKVLAFMDVMPQGKGHVLVIPKKPSRNILDADPQILPHFIQIIQKLSCAVQKAFHADGVTLMQFNEEASGQTVFHLHFHIIPRFNGIALKSHSGTTAPLAKLEAEAEKIRTALKTAKIPTLPN